jgi:protein-disulfide isomerase
MAAPRKRPAARSRRRSRAFYRSSALWAGVALVAIIVGALWWSRRESGEAAEPDERARGGAPVPLSEATPAEDEAGPRRTTVTDPRQLDTSDDPHRGDPKAPVQIIEFADYQCPSCGQFFADTYKALDVVYPNLIEWVFLDFPLAQHERAMPAAVAAACAHRQGKFWPYHDLLFQNQNRLEDGALRDYAEEVGVKMEEWSRCYEKQETRQQIEQDIALGEEIGVTGTPTFFVGGETLSGALPVTAFMEVIDPILKQAGAAAAAPSAPQGPGPEADAEAEGL